MADVKAAVARTLKTFRYSAGEFYGSAVGLSLGVGLIYQNVRFSSFNAGSRIFETLEGYAYVLTHECDVDQANNRHFNDHVLICPIILFGHFVEEYAGSYSEEQLEKFLPGIASDSIYRVFFLPPLDSDHMDQGGLLYLNDMCSTHVDEFSEGKATPVCALSEYAQNIFDLKLRNHLLRPKDEMLPVLR